MLFRLIFAAAMSKPGRKFLIGLYHHLKTSYSIKDYRR